MVWIKRSGYAVAVMKGVFVKQIVDVVLLMNPKFTGGSISFELKTYEGSHRTKVLDSKSFRNLTFEMRKEERRIAGTQTVVNMNSEETQGGLPIEMPAIDEETMVKLTTCEAQFFESGSEKFVPHEAGLLEAIKRLE